MAKESIKTEIAENQEETKAKKPVESKPAYRVNELAAKARQIFGTTPEIVTVALNSAGRETATVDETKKVVKAFLEREVK